MAGKPFSFMKSESGLRRRIGRFPVKRVPAFLLRWSAKCTLCLLIWNWMLSTTLRASTVPRQLDCLDDWYVCETKVVTRTSTAVSPASRPRSHPQQKLKAPKPGLLVSDSDKGVSHPRLRETSASRTGKSLTPSNQGNEQRTPIH